MTPAAVAAKFAELAGAVPGIAVAYDHVPESFRLEPALTMSYRDVSIDDSEIGGTERQEWTWRIYLYVELRNYADAEASLMDLVPKLLRIVQTDWTLAGTALQSRLEDEGGEPDPNHREDYLTKTLSLSAVIAVPL